MLLPTNYQYAAVLDQTQITIAVYIDELICIVVEHYYLCHLKWHEDLLLLVVNITIMILALHFAFNLQPSHIWLQTFSRTEIEWYIFLVLKVSQVMLILNKNESPTAKQQRCSALLKYPYPGCLHTYIGIQYYP